MAAPAFGPSTPAIFRKSTLRYLVNALEPSGCNLWINNISASRVLDVATVAASLALAGGIGATTAAGALAPNTAHRRPHFPVPKTQVPDHPALSNSSALSGDPAGDDDAHDGLSHTVGTAPAIHDTTRAPREVVSSPNLRNGPR